MSVLTVVLWILLVIVVLGGLNYGSVAVFGEKGDVIQKLCDKVNDHHSKSKKAPASSVDCKRVVQGILGLSSVALLGAAIAHSSSS